MPSKGCQAQIVSRTTSREVCPVQIALLTSSILVLFLVVALVREVRIRRALQTLLRRLLARWRNH
jgi:hypothetical protein